MANETYGIDVVVDPSKAKPGIDAIHEGLGGIEKTLLRIGELVGLHKLAHEAFELVESYEQLQNRLRNLTDGEAELAVVTDRLFEAANRSRTAFDATANIYVKLAQASKGLGFTQEQLLTVTEALNKAAIISGQGSEVSSGAVRQLSLALQTGTLNSRALRIILAELPTVAEAIEKQLGATGRELKKLGQEGKITGDVLISALVNASDDIEKKFAKVVPTISQSFAVLRNNFEKFLGEANEGAGITAKISQAILFLANHVDLLVRGATLLSSILIGELVGKAFNAVITGLHELTAAFLTNPLTELPAIIALAVGALVAFGDKLQVASDSAANLQDVFIVGFEEAIKQVHELADLIESFFHDADEEGQDAAHGIGTSFRDVLIFLATFVDSGLGLFQGLYNAVIEIFTGLPRAVADLAITTLNVLITYINDRLKEVTTLELTVFEELRDIGSAVGTFFVGLGDAAKAALTGSFSDAKKLIGSAVEGFNKEFGNIKFGERLEENLKAAAQTEGFIPLIQSTFEGAANELGEGVRKGFEEGLAFDYAEGFVGKVLSEADAKAEERQQEQFKKAREQAEARKKLASPGAIEVGSNSALDRVLADLEREGQLLEKSNTEREIGNELLKIEKDLRAQGITLTPQEEKQVENALRRNLALKQQSAEYEKILGPFEKYQQSQAALNALLEKGRITQEQYNEAQEQVGLGKINKELDDQVKLLLVSNAERDTQNKLLQYEKQLRSEGVVLGAKEKEELRQRLEFIKSLNAQNSILEKLHGAQEQAASDQDAANELWKAGMISADEYRQVLDEVAISANATGKSIESGFTRGFAKVDLQLNDLASLSEKTLVDAFSSAEDALVSFATTGKISFSGLVSSILADIARLAARGGLQQLFGLFGGLFGGGLPGGAAFSGPNTASFGLADLGLIPRAEGGPVDPSQEYIVGEKGPERFKPNVAGTIVPNGQNSGSSQGNQTHVKVAPAQVHLHVVNVMDPSEVHNAMASAEGDKIIMNSLSRNKRNVKRLTS